ncbi:MAG: hypothetical protein HXS50_01590 [Theionarchaea archaeon]|nr:hypothetical protein [Theionarchaea archaeon]
MKKPDEACLKLSAYVTAHSVDKDFGSPRSRNSAIKRLKLMGITKVYIEAYRGGFLLEEEALAEVRDHLLDSGFEVSGGIATTHGEGFTEKSSGGPYWVCYSSPVSLENLERASRVSARVFDEVIIDDFLCTACKCSRCRDAKGNREWGELYQDLLYDFTTRRLILPAREENPEVRLIIKYPQWYDRFHKFGYDVVRQTEAFDAVWVGTEIRDPRIDFVYQYQPFVNYSYLRSVGGAKVQGAWFDFLWCYPEIYLEQAYQSILAGARELVLFSYGPQKYDRKNPNASALIDRTPMLERICSTIGNRGNVGIEAYKPPGSDPGYESYVFDYLGVNGFPLILTTHRPSGPSVFLPGHSLQDPDVIELIKEPGNTRAILASGGLLEGLADVCGITDLFGLSSIPVSRKTVYTYRFLVEGKEQLAEEGVLFRSHLNTKGARVISAIRGGRDYPTVTVNVVDGVSYIAASLDTFRYRAYHGDSAVTVAEPVSLIHLPQPYLDSLRNLLLSPLGVGFKSPPMVGLYMYSDGDSGISIAAIENFGDRQADIELTGMMFPRPFLDVDFEGTENSISMKIPGRELTLVTSSKR